MRLARHVDNAGEAATSVAAIGPPCFGSAKARRVGPGLTGATSFDTLSFQRRQMSVEISRSLGCKSVVELLDRLDSSCQRLETRGRSVQGLTRGPFSAFSCDIRYDDEDSPPAHVTLETGGASSQSSQGDVHPAAADAKEIMSERDSFGLNEYASNMAELEPGSALFPSFDSAANLNDWFDSFEDSVFDPFLAPPTMQGSSGSMLPPIPLDESLLDTTNISMETSSVVVDNHLAAASPDASPGRIWHGEDNATRRLSIIAPDLTPAAETILPPHSEPLIRYYRQQIYEGRFLQAKKASPWQSIFFPCALETFAELSLWRTTTKTRYALLYALLALSSFNRWSRNDDSNGVGGKSWYEVGCCYQQGAQHHLRSALATEMTGLEQARYKELLMAILAVSMISATQDLLDNPDAKALAQGLHQAIIIYYYRKVAKVSRMVIQSIVEKALDYLEPCIARINDQDLTPCIAWAVSTAACEAATSALQEKALRVLGAVEEQGVFLPNMPSRDTLTMKWQQQTLVGVY
ncbi:unnamed protein product [Clonostachys solani]|uniref:Uncharacterized protein n=1 Tax=Clonostachys solani TaxID=160281 RepID=A0A9P0EPN8_9HYPO|nr:unnamed protein product [Clonostachys solani]